MMTLTALARVASKNFFKNDFNNGLGGELKWKTQLDQLLK